MNKERKHMYYINWLWNTLKPLSNLTFSILLLLIIAAFSILGTIIEQDHMLEFYQQKYPINDTKILDFNWQIIQQFKLDTIYTTKPFLGLILLFGLSLIICTFSTQLPSFKNARRWKFKRIIPPNKQLHEQYHNELKTSSSINYYLNKIDYYIFYQNNYIYGYKGLHGRLAPIFVHLGLISLLFGTCISLFTAFSLQEMIPIGETFNMQNIVKAGLFSKIPTNLTGTVNTFNIEYYPDKSIKQFHSLITLINKNTNTVQKKIISVNDPLYFEGLTIYQTDWQINGLRLEIDNRIKIQVPVIKFQESNNTYWISTFTYDGNSFFSLLLADLNGEILCYDKNGILISKLQQNETITVQNIPIKITNILASTGLQIKQDPGIPIIYFSFAILMISTMNSYISYAQIWVILDANKIEVSGIINRSEIKFEEDIVKLKTILLRAKNSSYHH